MNVNDKITKIFNSPLLSSALFLTSGISNTWRDVKNADEKYKKNFLIKDTVVLGGAVAGMFVSGNIHLLSKKISPVTNAVEKFANKLKDKIITDKVITDKIRKNTIDNKYVQNTLNYAREIINSTLLNCSMFACGVIGAVAADSILAKFNFEQPENQKFYHNKNGIEKLVDENLNKYVKKEDKKILYARLYDMPQLSMFAPSIIGEEALKISRENDTKKKLKHTTSSLINNSLIPMFLLSTSTLLTHKMNSFLRIPTIFVSMVAGTKGINYLRKLYIEKKDAQADKTLQSK